MAICTDFLSDFSRLLIQLVYIQVGIRLTQVAPTDCGLALVFAEGG